MTSYLFQGMEILPDSVLMEGSNEPDSLVVSGGIWMGHAGSAMLDSGRYDLVPVGRYVWLCLESGSMTLQWNSLSIGFLKGDACVLPSETSSAFLEVHSQSVLFWIAFDGPLAPSFIRQLGALLHSPIRQKALPSQINLTRQTVQVMVRHSGTDNASYQLQQIMWGILASRWGQPVAMNAMLSHEIGKVVDVLQASHYKDNFSLQQMADISRIPMETFRKRFVNEVGMPPLSYVLYCKMEYAKELLRSENYTVREAGFAVGMKDPYHFSKQFKNIVGISPSTFIKQVREGKKKQV